MSSLSSCLHSVTSPTSLLEKCERETHGRPTTFKLGPSYISQMLVVGPTEHRCMNEPHPDQSSLTQLTYRPSTVLLEESKILLPPIYKTLVWMSTSLTFSLLHHPVPLLYCLRSKNTTWALKSNSLSEGYPESCPKKSRRLWVEVRKSKCQMDLAGHRLHLLAVGSPLQ